jgi:hypothetical protein
MIWFAPVSAIHSEPSSPATIPNVELSTEGRAISVIAPLVVMRPTRVLSVSVNHKALSGPRVMRSGVLNGFASSNSVIAPPVLMRPI